MLHQPSRERPGIGAAVHEELRQIGLLGLILFVVLEFVNKLRIIEFVVLELRI